MDTACIFEWCGFINVFITVCMSTLTGHAEKHLMEKKYLHCSFLSQHWISAHLLDSVILLLSSSSGTKDVPCIQTKRWVRYSSCGYRDVEMVEYFFGIHRTYCS